MSDSQLIQQLVAHPREHGGVRVITLAEVDRLHGRPDGAARKTFNRIRRRFSDVLVAGVHYFEVTGEDLVSVRALNARTRVHAPQKAYLLTERGYLMVVKSFRDQLSWKVQDQLVEGYFSARQLVEAVRGPGGLLDELNRLRQERDTMEEIACESMEVNRTMSRLAGKLLQQRKQQKRLELSMAKRIRDWPLYAAVRLETESGS